MRDIHTIKGSVTFFGVQGMADLCHMVEERCAATEESPSADDRALIAARWAELSGELGAWTNEVTGGQHVNLDRAEVEELLAAVARCAPRRARFMATKPATPDAAAIQLPADEHYQIEDRHERGDSRGPTTSTANTIAAHCHAISLAMRPTFVGRAGQEVRDDIRRAGCSHPRSRPTGSFDQESHRAARARASSARARFGLPDRW